MARARRAGLHAGGDAVFGLQVVVVNAVDAERAFLHHAVAVVIFARAIGAGPGTEFAADAGFGIDQHDAVFGALVGCAGGADGDAGRRFAMEAGARKMHDAGIVPALFLHFIAMDAVQPHAGGIGAIRIAVVKRRGIALRVPFLAGGGTGLAADAGVEVDDEAELFWLACGVGSEVISGSIVFSEPGTAVRSFADWSVGLFNAHRDRTRRPGR